MLNDQFVPFLSEILSSFNFDIKDIDLTRHVEIVSNPEHGDIATNIAFMLAKNLKKSPKLIAEELAPKIQKILPKFPFGKLITEIVPINGYLNFRLDTGKLVNNIVYDIESNIKKFGKSEKYSNFNVIVEHTSANPTKPLHIGHIRNMIVGDTLARMYNVLGSKVTVLNYIDDMGKQMASLITGFLEKIHLEVAKPPDLKYDVWLGLIYSEVDKKASKDDKLRNLIEDVLTKTKKDPKFLQYNREIALQCVLSNLETAFKLNVNYDALIWESDIALSKIWKQTFKILEKNDEHFTWETEGHNKGAFIARLSHLKEFKNLKNPDKVIVRSNKVPTYVANDIGFQFWKFGLLPDIKMKFYPLLKQKLNDEEKILYSSNYRKLPQAENIDFGKATRVINVIGAEQTYLQNVIRHIFRLLGEEEKANNSVHLSYKHVILPDQRFSGRSGNWYEEESWGDRVLERTIDAAYESTSERRKDLEKFEKRKISQILGSGALRYWLIKYSLEKTITFDFDEVTRLIGDTAPFIVYTVVRASRILEKSPKYKNKEDFTSCITEYEKRLAMHMSTFPDILLKAVEGNKPSEIAGYANQSAVLFNQFYENCRVNDETNPGRSVARAALVKAYNSLLKRILIDILGIDVPSQM
ncbi:MAG: Arginine--tRNA ligase [Candidatus Heimdallarchaeota archaeon LC_3]|nr:MAG: Arginine--tRNA ligase [Candidatus Heimdallarchaeota archaeon LC_3]